MKQWYEYQLAKQVKKPELNDIEITPIANLAHLCEPLRELKKYKDQSYFRSYIADKNFAELAAANTDDLTKEQIQSWIDDPDFKDYHDRTGISYIEIPDHVKNLVINDIANTMQADPKDITVVINLVLPGQMLGMHVDRLKYAENNEKRTDDLDTPYARVLLFLDDWQPGQALQVGKHFIKWQAGDMLQWSAENVYHGIANFGFDDCYILRIDVNYPHPWRLDESA